MRWLARTRCEPSIVSDWRASVTEARLAILPPVPVETWYGEYLQSDHWSNVRQRALQRAEYACQLCKSVDRLQVHHNTYDRLGCEADNDVVVLCRACHEAFHASRTVTRTQRYWEVTVRARFVNQWNLGFDDEWRVQKGRFLFQVVEVVVGDASKVEPHRLVPLDVRMRTHTNGSPWGGSNYRRLVEELLGRNLRRGEVPDITSLRGRMVNMRICYHPAVGEWCGMAY